MRKGYEPCKDGLRDLQRALLLHAKAELTEAERIEFQSLLAQLDRLRASEVVDMISGALNGGLPLRPVRREAIPIDETAEDERRRREREERTF